MALEIIGEILRLTVFAGLSLAGILVILIWKKDLTRKVSYLRIFIQMVSMVAFFYLFTYPIWLLLMLGVILIMTLVLGRFFCGWFCPFGFYMDLITELRKAFKIRYRNLPEKLNRSLHKLRYALLVVFLILPFILSPIDPQLWPLALFFIGPFKPLRILLGPLIPLIVPWKELIVIGELNISYPYLQDIIDYSSGNFISINVFVFIILTVIGSFIFRRFWCRFCPTGASIAIVNRFRGFKWTPVLHLDKDEEKCPKCGICKRVCPVQVTEVYEQKGGKIMTSMCMLCLRCVEMCPYEGCLKVKVGRKTVFESRNWLEPSTTE
jgi:ferredoxin-type protein NapH